MSKGPHLTVYSTVALISHPSSLSPPFLLPTSILSSTFPSPNLQAFIHPSLARFFWSAARSDPAAMTWSPYEYCNGTFTATSSHSFTFFPSGTNLGDFVFIDFAGSGLVHLCGKRNLTMKYLTAVSKIAWQLLF